MGWLAVALWLIGMWPSGSVLRSLPPYRRLDWVEVLIVVLWPLAALWGISLNALDYLRKVRL